MGIFSNFIKTVFKDDRAVRQSLPSSLSFGRAVSPNNSQAALVRQFHSWVAVAAGLNARAVAATPLRLFAAKPSKRTRIKAMTCSVTDSKSRNLKETRWNMPIVRKAAAFEELLDHPVLDLLHSVNPVTNQFELIEMLQLHLELTGNAYMHTVDGTLGIPEELWSLLPHFMKIIPDPIEVVKAYEYGTFGNKRLFEKEEIIHFKMPNPGGIVYGMGNVEMAIWSVTINTSMQQFEANTFANRALPDVLLLPESGQAVSKPQVDQLIEAWENKFRGPTRAGRVGVTPPGIAKVEVLTPSMRDLSYKDGKKAVIDEIAAVFGVPLSMLRNEDSNRSTAVQGNIQYAKRTLLPKLERLEQKINEQLMPRYDEKLFVAFDNPVPEDLQLQASINKIYLDSGVVTINETREGLNLPPVPWGDTPLQTQVNVAPVTDSIQLSPAKIDAKEKRPEAAIPLDKPIETRLERLVRIMRGVFESQRSDVLSRLEEPKSMAGIRKKNFDINFVLLDEDLWKSVMAEKSEAVFAEVIVEGGKDGAETIGQAASSFAISNPDVQLAARTWTFRFAIRVTRTQNERLRRSLADGLAGGETIPEIRKRVNGVFDDMSKFSAERIARTETSRAAHAGTQLSWERSGVVSRKQWLTTSDPCQFCRAMGAKFGPGTNGIPLGGDFAKLGDTVDGADGGKLTMGYSDVPSPPIHPHCLCTIIPILDDE